LKEPKDVLELGRFLARELGADDGVDTLGRWMAYYLAEQLDAAERATGAEKEKIERGISTLILDIWAQRCALQGTADPLAPYEKAAHALAAIRSGAAFPSRWSRSPVSDDVSLALDVFELASRLALLSLFSLIPADTSELPASIEKFLSVEEGVFLTDIGEAYAVVATEFPNFIDSGESVASKTANFQDTRLKLVQSLQVKAAKLTRENEEAGT
jgi:hypothetical protein